MVPRSLVGLSAAALAWAPSARARGVPADGSPVPAWVEVQCCGVADLQHLSPDQVHRVDGCPRVISDGRLLPSQDGDR